MSDPPTTNQKQQQSGSRHVSEPWPIAVPLSIAALMLGISAGFTMYPRKVGSMLQRMKLVDQARLKRNPPKYGPPTKEEWEKMRPRFDKDDDDFF